MRARNPLVVIVAVVAFAATAPGALSVKAGSPNPLTVATGGPSQGYSGTVSGGQPDVDGPPAPACSGTGLDGCDRETVNLTGGPAQLTLTVSYTPSDPSAQNCLDIAIEDASASKVFAHQTCAPSGTSIKDPNAATVALNCWGPIPTRLVPSESTSMV